MDALNISQLRKTFGATVALDGLDLRVSGGQIFGLVGPDGAGKTTLLRILVGALRADGGAAAVAGADVLRDPEGVRQRIGYMPQRFSLYGDLTVAENLRFFADAYGVPRAARPALFARLLTFSRLDRFQDRRADALSGGMKQKLALACTLVHRPQVLLLDEPTTGVDPVARREFWQILREAVAQDGMTVVVATPYMDEADRCHSVAFIQAGRVLAQGTPRELQALLPGVVIEVTATPLNAAASALSGTPGLRAVQTFGDRLHLLADAAVPEPQIAARLSAANVTLHAARAVSPTMEDVFLYLRRKS